MRLPTSSKAGVVSISFFCLSAFVCGCGGGSGFGLLDLLTLSEEDIEAAAQAQEDFDARVDALQNVRVRIINETDSIARASVSAGLTGPEVPDLSSPIADALGAFGDESFLTTVDSATVLVEARGTVEGEIKCGEVLAVSAAAPFDLGGLDYGGEGFGLFVDAGNISFSGAGSAGQEEFTGDRVTTARFVRPADDGLDCSTGTLVIRIQAAAADAVHDPQTGQLVASRTAGSGTLSIE